MLLLLELWRERRFLRCRNLRARAPASCLRQLASRFSKWFAASHWDHLAFCRPHIFHFQLSSSHRRAFAPLAGMAALSSERSLAVRHTTCSSLEVVTHGSTIVNPMVVNPCGTWAKVFLGMLRCQRRATSQRGASAKYCPAFARPDLVASCKEVLPHPQELTQNSLRHVEVV